MVSITLITCLVLLITRLYFVFNIKKNVSLLNDGDAIGHLNYVQDIIGNKGKIHAKINRYILDYNDYPNGFHRLFYFLKIPLRAIEKYGGLVPIICDCLLLLFTCLMVYYYGGDQYWWILTFPFLRLFIANEGRSSHFSERAYGVLWGNIFLASMIAFSIDYNFVWLGVGSVSFLIFSTSSKFAWQATFILTLIISITKLSIVFILFYAICFFIACTLSGGYNYQVLKGVIRHSVFYKNYLSHRYFKLPNHYKDAFNIFDIRHPRRVINTVLNNSIFKILSDNPLNFLILILVIIYGDWSIYSIYVLGGALLVLIIAMEPFKFLGEPERYLEFTIIPTYIALSFYDLPFEFTVPTLLVILGLFAVHMVLFIKSNKHRSTANDDQSKQDLIDFFAREANKTVLTIPLRLSFLLGYHSTDNKYVTLLSNIGIGEDNENYKNLIPDYYPYPGADLDQYIKNYNIDYIVVDMKRVDTLDKHIKKSYYDFEQYSKVLDNGHYIILNTNQGS